MQSLSLAASPLALSRRFPPRLTGLLVLLLVLASTAAPPAEAEGAITPPGQPVSGPGGREYMFEEIAAVRVGDAPTGAWLFAPEGTAQADRATLPVVLFLHGFGATDPALYQDWIDHLVRRGTVVIYPDYQEPGYLGGGQAAYLANLFAGAGEALTRLGTPPDQVHVVGHSLGAVLTAAYGVLAPAADLPPATTLTMIEPGGCRNCGNFGSFGVPLPLTRRIAPEILVRTVVGGDDDFVGDADARSIQQMLGDIPADRKAFETIPSDEHGLPALVADHLFPQTGGAGGETDALDWFGLWRPFDALVSCADRREACAVALGASDEHRFMGEWSDGTPVLPPVPVR